MNIAKEFLNDYPKNIKVFVVPTAGNVSENAMFRARGFHVWPNPEECDIAVFTGGSDVNPALYGELLVPGTTFSSDRDAKDIAYWRRIPKTSMKVGICRGGQLMNVLNGGRLWQDADGHAMTGGHYLKDLKTGANIKVSSTHHQQFRPAPDAEIVAVAHLSSRKWAENIRWNRQANEPEREGAGTDYEVLWYGNTRTLCFQPHPEYSEPPTTEEYFFQLIARYI